MIIPHDQLSPEALQGLIEDFVTRDGTDYGLEEVSLERKAEQVRRQLGRGLVVIIFDTQSESVTLVTREELAHRIAQGTLSPGSD